MAERQSKLPRRPQRPDDLALWQEIAKTAKPLAKGSRRRALRSGTAPPEAASPGAAPGDGRPQAPRPRPAAPPPRPAAPPELGHGTSAGLDRRSAERLRRGKLPIEGRLDLHGLDQARAQAALERFLGEAQAQGKRCVLVVTGKGLGRPDGGVLRQAVPRWLNQPPNRSRVLSFCYAQPRDGGSGALYLLLRRRREA